MKLNGEGVYILGPIIDLIATGDITPHEAMLYFIINQSDSNRDSNRILAQAVGCTTQKAGRMVASLCEKGLIHKIVKKGKRILQPCPIMSRSH